MNDSHLEQIKNSLSISIFRNLPPGAVDELARTVQSRIAEANEFIFKEGDQPDALYVIVSGRVRVFVSHKDKIERELSIRGPGEHFGEVALLTAQPRTANALSLERTLLIMISKEQFDRLLDEHPGLSRNFMRQMRDWLIQDQRIIEEEADAVIKSSRVSWFDFVLVIGVSILLAVTLNFSNPYGIQLFPAPPDPVPGISPPAAMEGFEKGKIIIVDAMPTNFYQTRHIKGAVNITPALFDIMCLVSLADDDREKEIVVYGNTISRPYDLETAGKLTLRGFNNVKVLDGGIKAWEDRGYPVEQKVSR